MGGVDNGAPADEESLAFPTQMAPAVCSAKQFGDISLLMIMARIYPHEFGLAGSLEAALSMKLQCAAIGDQHLLMKSVVPCHKPAHQLRTDPTSLILGQHQQVRIVNHQWFTWQS